jgi:hypothetical protein
MSEQQGPSIAGKISVNRNGEVNISGSVNSTVGGDVVGLDNFTIKTGAVDEAKLQQAFEPVRKRIEELPNDPNVDKGELRETVNKIWDEVKKGEAANATKVERWLKFLAGMSYEVFHLTTVALLDPGVRIGVNVREIVLKSKEAKR